jgi:hypothetical protein
LPDKPYFFKYIEPDASVKTYQDFNFTEFIYFMGILLPRPEEVRILHILLALVLPYQLALV